MSQAMNALGGPVLAWEARRATRRKLWRILPLLYCAWLVIQAGASLRDFKSVSNELRISRATQHPSFFVLGADYFNFLAYLASYLDQLLYIQLLLVMLLAPALTATCLAQEKERGTIFALLGTHLTSRQILLGKLLGRLTTLVPFLLTTLPLVIFLATVVDRSVTVILLAFTQQIVMVFALGALGLLFAIGMRKAVDAVIATYAFLGLVYLALYWFTTNFPQAAWLDPGQSLTVLLDRERYWPLAVHLIAWPFIGIICLDLGRIHLRKVCVEQRDRRPPRRIWAFRPPVGNHPIRWRECYVIGLSPMPILRVLPRWLALLAAFMFSAAVASVIAHYNTPGLLAAVLDFDFSRAFARLRSSRQQIAESVWFMGVVFIVLADFLLLLRCSTSISDEKRRNTWDDLLLTAQSFREITTGKMWGILQATVPYLIAYSLPVFLLASVGGVQAMIAATLWILVPSSIVFLAACLGIDMVRVPRDMDETRPGGAFWFENVRAAPQTPYVRPLRRLGE